MLVIKKQLIQPSTYTYGAIGAAAFVVTFGALSLIMPLVNNDRSAAESSKIAKDSQTATDNTTAMRKVAFQTGTSASLPDTNVVNNPQQAAAVYPQPSVAPTASTTNEAVAAAAVPSATPVVNSSPQQPSAPSVNPAPADNTTNTPPAANPQPQDTSLLGGVVGGVVGVVDALL